MSFGVRPEHLRIEPATGTSDFVAIVELVEPMGSDSLVWIKLQNQSLSVRVESSERHHPGEKVQVTFRVGLSSIFDAESGERL